MGIVTSTEEQRRVAEAARRVGGYEQLTRLANERRVAGAGAKLTYDQDERRWTYSAKKA